MTSVSEKRLASFLEPLQRLVVPTAITAVDAAAATGGGALSPSDREELIKFSVQKQQRANWCWAAVSTSVAVYFGSKEWTQCKLASLELELECCKKNYTEKCNQRRELQPPLKRVGHFREQIEKASSFAQLQAEIHAGRPLCCRVLWSNQIGHFVVIAGWSIAPEGTQYVEVRDPIYGPVATAYDEFCSAYREPGTPWTHSYFIHAVAPTARGPWVAKGTRPKMTASRRRPKCR
jgi:hypothetical protein